MRTSTRLPAPPSTDKRWRLVEATMSRLGHQGNALIEALHSVQEAFGYLDPESLRFVAAALRLPPSHVHGVATFYHFFTLKPTGQHSCVVCLGTACYIKGAGKLLTSFEETVHIKPGQTTADGKVSLLAARCLGSCGLAPAAVFDREIVGKVTPEQALARIQRWTDDNA